MRAAAAFVLGLVVGTGLFAAGAARGMEALRLDLDRCLARAQQLDTQLNLQRTRESRQGNARIAAVQVVVDFPDERVTLEMQTRLTARLRHYMGRRADQVDPLFVYADVQGRLLQLEGTTYRAHVRAVTGAGTRLVVHVAVEAVTTPESPAVSPG